ncbi:MAG TPA: hypothetical protein DDX71_03870 [Ruminococcus sp.]|nr:hypothetical protein [Ruminococcus sp.]
MCLRDALCEDPLDPHLEAVRSIPALLIWGAVFGATAAVVTLLRGGTLRFALTGTEIIASPYLLIAGAQYLHAICWLRRRERAMTRGICVRGEILGAEYVGGNRSGFWVSGIRLPDDKEFFSPHYRTSTEIYQICDVYIYRHRRYLTNFRRGPEKQYKESINESRADS